MIARALSRYRLDILLIDREADVCMGSSASNTAIIHAGYDAVPGTLKAAMNVAGNAMWGAVADDLHIHFDRCGDYVVAVGPDQVPKLDTLMERGRRNGVPGMALLSADEMRRREPLLNPEVSGALWASTGGIVDPFGATVAAAENAVMNGVTLLLETACEGLIRDGSRIVGVQTNRGEFGCRWVVNSAGLYADEVMHRAGVRPDFRITPRRGEYYILDKAAIRLNSVMFPVPDAHSKGILVTTTTHGNVIVGPNSHDVADKEDRAVTRAGLDEVAQGARKLIPSLDLRQVIATFAGLRATGNAPCETPGVDYRPDYVIEVPAGVQGLVNLGGIESPGLASSPAIARRVVDLMRDAGERLEERRDWNPVRLGRPCFREMTEAERERLVRIDPRYGRIVCRCEYVTEGEILAAIHAPIPARTYDAIKRRTWCGTGRCQGAFDTPRVAELLAQELGIPMTAVSKKGPGSELLARRTKDVDA
ncbi:MAG: NAD(P)/FAD-dependent oxidoreductase [Chloroflexi bacterium]|nr:NAD(P)/FAD-dependent oxidoreductase [Chloroflexota bacterium]MBU1746422.1 NAD(P)/FAD-dependent oxidoreductase [Chloroflexota bacterium]